MNLTPLDKLSARASALGLAAMALALFVMAGPPLLVWLLVFPALDITGWGAFWLTLVVFVVWWGLIRLYEVARALLTHASFTLEAARMLRAA